jgi:hypothetical protein
MWHWKSALKVTAIATIKIYIPYIKLLPIFYIYKIIIEKQVIAQQKK